MKFDEHEHIVAALVEDIGQFDNGALGHAINQAIRRCIHDIIQAPTDAQGKPQARKVLIELEYVGQMKYDRERGNNELNGVTSTGKVQTKLPAVVSNPQDCRIDEETAIPYRNAAFPQEFTQQPLFEDDKE